MHLGEFGLKPLVLSLTLAIVALYFVKVSLKVQHLVVLRAAQLLSKVVQLTFLFFA